MNSSKEVYQPTRNSEDNQVQGSLGLSKPARCITASNVAGRALETSVSGNLTIS